jgi:hypothetical protein
MIFLRKEREGVYKGSCHQLSPVTPVCFADLPRNHFKAILADPPWAFKTWTSWGNEVTRFNR